MRLGRAGLAWWRVLPSGGAVGDQAGDGQVGLVVVLAAPDVALQGPPLLVLGVGVLDADPLGGLLLSGLLPGRGLAGRGVLARLERRRGDLAGELPGQALVSSIDVCFDLRVLLEQVADSLGLDRGLVVHPAGPERPGPQRAAVRPGDDGGLLGVLPALAGDERPAAGPARPGAADLHLGAVHPQLHAVRGGVGEHVGQGPQPHAGAGHGEAPRGEQGPDLVHGPGDGGPVHVVEHGQHSVGELEPQHHQGGDHPVGEDELMALARARRPEPAVTPPLAQPGLLLGHPRPGQPGDQLAKLATGDAGADTMRQGRAGLS